MRELRIKQDETISRLLKSNNGLFDAVFNYSSEAIFLLSSNELTILECNNKAVEIFQCESKFELIDRSSFELFNNQLIEYTKNKLIKNIKNGLDYSQELAFKTLNDNVFWGRISLKQISVDDSNEIVLMRVNKVLENVNFSETLNTLIKNTSKVTGRKFLKSLTELLFKTFNAKHVYIAQMVEDNLAKSIEYYANHMRKESITVKIKGSPCANLLKGYISFYPRNLSDLFPEDNLVKKLKVESFLGVPIFNKDGQVKTILVLMDDKPMNENNNARSILSIFAPRIEAELERIKSEEKIQEQTNKLIEHNKIKDKFLQIIAHDLANPFGNVMSYSELLRRRIKFIDKERIESIVNNIDTSISASYNLLLNLTDWSRLQRNRMPFNPQDINLFEEVEAIISHHQSKINNKRLEVINMVNPEINLFVDQHMISSIIRNLLLNSIKYTPKGGEIVFNAEVNDKGISLSIRDNGIGFSESEVKTVFNVNQSTTKPGTNNESGSGIGLSLCKEFISMHNARIVVESTQGQGTTVNCIFPLKKENQ